MGNIHPKPPAMQFLRDGNRRAAAAEEIRHEIAFVGTRQQQAFQQSFGLLRRIAQPFLRLRVNRRNICPNIINREANRLVKIMLNAELARFRYINFPLRFQRVNRRLRRGRADFFIFKASAVFVNFIEPALQVVVRVSNHNRMIRKIVRFGITQNHVMTCPHICFSFKSAGRHAFPNNFVPKLIFPKNHVANDFEIMAHRRIAMQIKTAGLFQDFAHVPNPNRHCRQIGNRAFRDRRSIKGI